MKEEFKEVYRKFVDKYGLDSQITQCIEELSELTKELCKYQRYRNSDKEKAVVENIKEEIADVLNMVEQLQFSFGIDEIEKIRKNKIDRSVKKYLN